MNEMTAADKYRVHIESTKTKEIVDVHLPSGFVFQFEKPSQFSTIFGSGNLPQIAASGAIKDWTEAGIMKGLQEGDPDIIKASETMLRLRDRVLQLSYSPKLVVGDADPAKDELSTDNVANDDLAYLLNWVAGGGDASMMLNTFPQGSRTGAIPQPNRKERRAKAKQTGRAA